MLVQAGLCQTWSEPKLLVFSRTGSFILFFCLEMFKCPLIKEPQWRNLSSGIPTRSDHTCDISLFRRDLPIFEQISLFGISKFPYITYTSPYFKFKISLFEIKNFLLCLIILPILKSKSPYLASQMYHMYGSDTNLSVLSQQKTRTLQLRI